jgi:predicted dehydrogenase/threonine dehydrogenase-like Zn-dependent dehydrogenase
MQSVTLNFKTGEVKVEELPSPSIGPTAILVANRVSLISAGTEGYVIRMAQKGPIGKALDRPDLAKQVIQKALSEGIFSTAKIVQNLITAPLPLGYSCAGDVLESGRLADLFRPGDRVACAGLGMANHAEHVAIPRTMAAKMPADLSYEEAAFGTLGAIALQGVRVVNAGLGETFAVFGLGLLGQLTVQILSACGCRVVGFDIDPFKVELAKRFGLQAGGQVATDDVVQIVKGSTGGYGADGVIITAHAKTDKLINLAADVCREKGRISAVGLVNLNVPRRKFFEKELRLEVSRAYGPGAYDSEYERKGSDYPLAYVRWTEGRNLAAFIDLVARKKVLVEPLITHRFPIERAAEAYDLVLGKRREPYIGILFTYKSPSPPKRSVVLRSEPLKGTVHEFNFGVIGAGRFAQGILLPALKSQAGVRIAAVATGSGLSASHVGNKYQAERAVSDYREILNMADIGSVFIATRHNLHGTLVCEAMKAQKNIFVEKPLAITEEELDTIVSLLSDYRGILTVGFNRRFAPLSVKFRELFAGRHLPLVINYRFLTPLVQKGHESEWVHDPSSGGSRIVGEVCHMVDLVGFLIGSRPKRVFASSVSSDAPAIPNYDNVQINLSYEDGSIAHLTYVANSDTSIPQERLEIYGEESFAMIDNFKRGFFSHRGKRTRFGGISQRKGWKEEIETFISCLRTKTLPIPYHSLFDTTRVTFLIHRSLETGRVMECTAQSIIAPSGKAETE